MTTTTRSTALDELLVALDDAVRRPVPDRVKVTVVHHALRPFLGRDGLLTTEQRTGRPDRYTTHLLHVADDGAFSLVALIWLPGQETPVHDHLSWCVVGVHEGVERETRYQVSADGTELVPIGASSANVGDVAECVPPGDIHRVRNDGSATAVSLHVYGVDVRRTGSSIHRRYDLPVGGRR